MALFETLVPPEDGEKSRIREDLTIEVPDRPILSSTLLAS
jgi:hypothetical protein